MTNPFAVGPQAAPAQQQISDAAAQQFGAPAQQQGVAQAVPGQQQFAPSPQGPTGDLHTQAHGFAQAQTPAQAQQYAQQFAGTQTAQNGGFPPSSPYAQPQQAYAPPAPAPVQQQPAQGFVQAQQFAPPQPASPSPFAGVTPQGGGGIDPSLFGAPSAGGGGVYPKVRDLEARLCLFVVKNRNSEGTAYGDPTKKINNYIVNVAVLDGGPLYASPSKDTPMAQPVLVSNEVPYVVQAMTISQVGLQNRLNNQFTRGRIVKIPKDAMAAQLAEAFPGMEPWQALWTWVSQDPARAHQLGSGTYFWGIVEDNSEQANALVAAFAQNPVSNSLMA